MSTGNISADAQTMMTFESSKKSAGVAYLLWFFLGYLGIHRFYLKRTLTGVIQLALNILGWCTIFFVIGLIFLIPLGIWLLVDLFLISGMVREYNLALVNHLSTGQQNTSEV